MPNSKSVRTQTQVVKSSDKATSTEPHAGKLYSLPLSMVTKLDKSLSEETPTTFSDTADISLGAKALKFIRSNLHSYRDELILEKDSILENITQRYDYQLMVVNQMLNDYEKLYIESLDSLVETDTKAIQDRLNQTFSTIRREGQASKSKKGEC